MFKNLGIKWKFMLIVAVIAPVLAGMTLYLVSTFSQQMTDAARQRSLETATRYANKIEGDMSKALISARTFARVVEGVAGTDEVTREGLTDAMVRFLEDHPNYLGVFYALEPDVIGSDSEYVNADYHREDGRYVPWVHRDSGQIRIKPSSGYPNDDAGGQWYHRPRKSGRETVMEPWAYEIGGEQVQMVDMIIPITKQGRFLGVAGVDFPMGTIDRFIKEITLYDTGYAFLLSNAGAFMAHPESEKYVEGGVNFFESPDFGETLKRGIRDKVLRGETFSAMVEQGGDDILYTATPITIGRSTTPLGLVLRVPMDEVLAGVHAMRDTTILIAVGALVVVVAAILLIARTLINPIRQTAEAVEAIAEGDLGQRLPADSTDEVGRMQASVNHMAEELARNIEEIREQQAMAEEKTRLAEKATEEAENACRLAETAKSEGMLAAAERLEAIVANVSSASEEISAQSNEIRNGVDVQRERIASTATAMEEMNATVLEVARNAGETAEQSADAKDKALAGAGVVNETVEAMDSIQRQAQELTRSMNELGEQAEGIGAIMTVIEDIADQTNLLALNAAIEAARAGEAGRGFAVVADEVRKLAEKTMGATKEVGESIRSIQDVARGNIESMDRTVEDIASATELSGRSGEMLTEIVGRVEDSAARIQSIATAAEEQSATSEEINRSVDEINRIAEDTAAAVGEAATAAENMARQAQELGIIINDLKSVSG